MKILFRNKNWRVCEVVHEPSALTLNPVAFLDPYYFEHLCGGTWNLAWCAPTEEGPEKCTQCGTPVPEVVKGFLDILEM